MIEKTNGMSCNAIRCVVPSPDVMEAIADVCIKRVMGGNGRLYPGMVLGVDVE